MLFSVLQTCEMGACQWGGLASYLLCAYARSESLLPGFSLSAFLPWTFHREIYSGPTHWLIPYCHIPETIFEVHTAWSVVSPRCSLSWQYKELALPQGLLIQPRMACSQPMDCCSWKAVNTACPILSSSAGVWSCKCTGPPVDHCEMLWPRVAIMNGHVDLF